MRILTVLTVFLLFTPCVQAADIDSLSVGDRRFIKAGLSYDEVYVTEIRRASNRVRVRRAESNTLEWVDASRLVTLDVVIADGLEFGWRIGEAMDAAVEFFAEGDRREEPCRFGERCDRANFNEEPRGVFARPNPFADPPGRLKVQNTCQQTIELAVRFRNERGDWDVRAWYDVPTGVTAYLTVSSEEYVATDASFFYFYAQSPDGTYVWEGDYEYEVEGTTVGMRMMSDNSGDRDLSLVCPDP